MPESKHFSQPDDAVLSDSKGDRGSLILGGIEGVKQRLSSNIEAIRIEAVSQAYQYGKEGLDLIIKAFYEDTLPVRREAYKLLRDRQESEVKKVLQESHIWQYCERLLSEILPCSDEHQTTAISANGRILARTCAESFFAYRDCNTTRQRDRKYWVEIWDLQTFEKIRTLNGFNDPVHLALTSDGKILITGEGCASYLDINSTSSHRERLKVWDISTGEKVFFDRVGAIESISLGSDNVTLAASHYTSVGRDWLNSKRLASITVWNLAEKQKSHQIDWGQRSFTEPCHIALHSTEKIVIGYHNLCGKIYNAFVERSDAVAGNIKAWDISSDRARELYSLSIPHPYQVKCLAANPNGLSFASSIESKSYIPGALKEPLKDTIKQKSITLWKLKALSTDFAPDRQKKRCLTLLENPVEYIRCHSLAFSLNGRFLASGNRTNKIKLWDLESYQEIRTFLIDGVAQCIQFHQNGNILYIATNQKVTAWGWQEYSNFN